MKLDEKELDEKIKDRITEVKKDIIIEAYGEDQINLDLVNMWVSIAYNSEIILKVMYELLRECLVKIYEKNDTKNEWNTISEREFERFKVERFDDAIMFNRVGIKIHTTKKGDLLAQNLLESGESYRIDEIAPKLSKNRKDKTKLYLDATRKYIITQASDGGVTLREIDSNSGASDECIQESAFYTIYQLLKEDLIQRGQFFIEDVKWNITPEETIERIRNEREQYKRSPDDFKYPPGMTTVFITTKKGDLLAQKLLKK